MARVVKTVANSLGPMNTIGHRDAVVIGGDGYGVDMNNTCQLNHNSGTVRRIRRIF